MTTLWITGAGGFIGAKLVERATRGGHFEHVHAFDLKAPHASGATVHTATLDIGDRDAVQARARQAPPDVIINPAALADVEDCEKRPDDAWQTNVLGPTYLAEVARERDAHLIHVSTDYVFPGDETQPGPYAEDAAPRPINVYGKTKRAGEEAVTRICGAATRLTIARTALVYGPGGRRDFVARVLRPLAAHRRLPVLEQANTPTLVDDLAEALLWMAEHATTGLYHVAGPDLIDRYDWAVLIARHFGLDASLVERATPEAPGQTSGQPKRPRWSGLLCERWCAEAARGAPQPRDPQAALREVTWGFPM